MRHRRSERAFILPLHVTDISASRRSLGKTLFSFRSLKALLHCVLVSSLAAEDSAAILRTDHLYGMQSGLSLRKLVGSSLCPSELKLRSDVP